jgi:hypothetical protein
MTEEIELFDPANVPSLVEVGQVFSVEFFEVQGVGGPGGGGTGDVIGPTVSVDSDFAQFDGTTGHRIKDGGLSFDNDSGLSAISDTRIPSQKAVKDYVDNQIAGTGDVHGPVSSVDLDFTVFDGIDGKVIKDSGLSFDVDGTLVADSDQKIPSQKAVKSYVDSQIAGTGTGDVHGPAGSTDNNLVQFNGVDGKHVKDGGLSVDVNTSLGVSDLKLPSQKAVKTYADTGDAATLATAEAYAQPLDSDLTAIAALSDLDSMFYRHLAGDWRQVIIGAGLSFALGNLSATATVVKRNFSFSLRKTAGVVVGKLPGFWACPFSGTIVGWNITVDTGTITFKIWKIATGTAKPTAANSINTAGISLSTGTSIRSTVLIDFTTLAVTAGDIFACEITAVSGVTEFGGAIEITQT